MNKNIAVIYKSNYGSTKTYATWIAGKLNADIYDLDVISLDNISNYNTLIFGAGIYASSVSGIRFIKKFYNKLKDKRIIVFLVGLSNTKNTEFYDSVINRNFTDEMKKNIKFFFLRGSIYYKRLHLMHALMMYMLKTITSKKTNLTEDEKAIVESYGDKLDFMNKDSIQEIVSYVIKESK